MKVCTVSYIIQSILSDETGESPVYNDLSPYPQDKTTILMKTQLYIILLLEKGFVM